MTNKEWAIRNPHTAMGSAPLPTCEVDECFLGVVPLPAYHDMHLEGVFSFEPEATANTRGGGGR